MIPVIICGGVGTKMWPESRTAVPKQFLPLLNGKSLFQENWQALRAKFAPEEIYLQTNDLQAKIAKEQVSEILDQNIFKEPDTRNTGPASGFSAAKLYQKFPDEPFMLVQADVMRWPTQSFLDMMEVCAKLAVETGKYITGGYSPSFPVMGVDYLIPGRIVSADNGMEVYEVDEFLWRAEKNVVEEYIEKRGALLHANHSCMTPRSFFEMYKKYKPEWYEPLMRIVEGADEREEYLKMPIDPIEVVTSRVHKDRASLVVKLPFSWTDFGTWESLITYSKQAGLNLGAELEEVDASGNFARTSRKKKVVFVGVEDLVVIDTEDALLICNKTSTGKVGEVIERLKKVGETDLI